MNNSVAQFFKLGPFFHQGQLVTRPLLYHYEPGTTQNRDAWTDRNRQTTAENPIRGDANGIVYGYFHGLYKIEVKTPEGSTLLQADGVQIIDPLNTEGLPFVQPETFGAVADGSTDNTDAFLESFSELSDDGGIIQLGTGDYVFSSTLARGPKPMIIQGSGIDSTFLSMSAFSSALHGITGTGSLVVRDLTIRMKVPLESDYQMHAIRMDLEASGVTANRFFHVTSVRAIGWNASFYCDGGENFAIQHGFYDHFFNEAGGPNSGYIGSCVYMNRVQHGYVGRGTIDQNDTGEHAIYCFGNRNITIEDNVVRNASHSENQAIKVVGNGAGSSSEVYGNWIIRNNDIQDCFNGILVNTFSSETLGNVVIHNNKLRNLPGSDAVFGAITVAVNGTSQIRQASIRDNDFGSLGRQGVHFTGATGAKIKLAIVDGLTGVDWSSASPGLHVLVGASGTDRIVGLLHLRNINVDGNSNGRCIWNVNGFGGYGTERIDYLDYDETSLFEENTTDGLTVPALQTGTATPHLRFGRLYTVTNGSAQNITSFLNIRKGVPYEFRFENGNTTLKEGALLVMAGSIDWNPQTTDVWRGRSYSGTGMTETGRSDNS
jgi:hypothetical protein